MSEINGIDEKYFKYMSSFLQQELASDFENSITEEDLDVIDNYATNAFNYMQTRIRELKIEKEDDYAEVNEILFEEIVYAARAGYAICSGANRFLLENNSLRPKEIKQNKGFKKNFKRSLKKLLEKMMYALQKMYDKLGK